MAAPTETPDDGVGVPDLPDLPEVRVADVTPVDVTGSRYVAAATAAWLVAFVVLLPFHDQLRDAGRGWWPWTCLVGLGLGLFAVEYCRRRARSLRQEHVARLPRPD